MSRIIRVDELDNLKERFYNKIIIEVNSNCWLWSGGTTRLHKGYGRMRYRGRKEQAHRVSWELHCGPIPNNMKILHKCDISLCVNPEHLFIGSMKDNMQDCALKERFGQAKLTGNKVLQIKKLISENKNLSDIAKIFNVTQSHISEIKNGKHWQHINSPLEEENKP